MKLKEVMAALAAKGSESVKVLWLKHRAKEPFFGVKVGNMKVIAQKLKGEQALAMELYLTGNGDAQYLAGLIRFRMDIMIGRSSPLPMIRRLGGVLAICALVAGSFAREVGVSATSAAGVEQQLIDLEAVWIRAEINHDTVTLRRILDDRFVNTGPSGKTVGKEEFIKGVTSGELNPTLTQTLSDRTFLVDGDTAVVIETDTVRWAEDGKKTTLVLRISVIYIKRHDRWMALAEHMVKVPPVTPTH